MIKKLLFVGAFAFALQSTAQIQLVSSSIINAGYKLTTHTDTSTAGLKIQIGGNADMSWDMSILKKHESDINTFTNPDWHPELLNHGTGANLALQENSDAEFTLLKKTSTGLSVVGSASDTGAGLYEVGRFAFDLIVYPIKYGDDTIKPADRLLFRQDDSLGFVIPPSGPTIDSIRIEYWINSTFYAKGSGILKFTGKTYQKVVFVENAQIIYGKGYAKIGNNWLAISEQQVKQAGYSLERDTTINHFWWNTLEGQGVPCMNYSFEPGDTIARDIDFVDQDAQATSVQTSQELKVNVYPNPAGNILMVDGFETGLAKVYKTNGQLVAELNIVNGNLDLSNLQKGNYVISLSNSTSSATLRIIKE